MGELRSASLAAGREGLRFAYVGLTPWLQQGSIRANILFGEPLDPDWLEAVVDACGLTADLAEMPAGLDTEVGEAGSRLSGGPKARVALARAVYQRADVYLFDDPLAALDTHVARAIIQKCLGRRGLLAGRTRILATHLPNWLYDQVRVFFKKNTPFIGGGTRRTSRFGHYTGSRSHRQPMDAWSREGSTTDS